MYSELQDHNIEHQKKFCSPFFLFYKVLHIFLTIPLSITRRFLRKIAIAPTCPKLMKLCEMMILKSHSLLDTIGKGFLEIDD